MPWFRPVPLIALVAATALAGLGFALSFSADDGTGILGVFLLLLSPTPYIAALWAPHLPRRHDDEESFTEGFAARLCVAPFLVIPPVWLLTAIMALIIRPDPSRAPAWDDMTLGIIIGLVVPLGIWISGLIIGLAWQLLVALPVASVIAPSVFRNPSRGAPAPTAAARWWPPLIFVGFAVLIVGLILFAAGGGQIGRRGSKIAEGVGMLFDGSPLELADTGVLVFLIGVAAMLAGLIVVVVSHRASRMQDR